MWRTGWAAMVVVMALSARAETVGFDGYTTLQAKPRSCRAVSFGPDVGGFDTFPDPEPETRYTFIMLAVEVTASETRTPEGKIAANPPPHMRIQNGYTTFLLEGRAQERCPQLKKPSLQLMLQLQGCGDMLPYRGTCVPPMRFVQVVEPPAC